jgi:long-chain acyl-CoA synthetase
VAAEPAVERLTAPAAEAAQQRVAACLSGAGIKAGERVAFVADTSVALLSAALACLRLGIVPVMCNPTLTPPERKVILDDCQPRWTVTEPAEMLDRWPGKPIDLAPWPLARPMHYTSGTTGRPKGVWSGVLEENRARRLFEDEAGLWDFSGEDVFLVCSPLHHSAPLRFASAVLGRGGTVVVMSRFEAGAAIEAVRRHGVTSAFMVPAHLQRLFSSGPHGAPAASGADLSRFRLLVHAGAPCPPVLKKRTMEAFPAESVWEFYGSTEGQFTVCSPADWEERPGTVGRARPGRSLSVDADGTVWCSPPDHAEFSYWRDPERTEKAWRVRRGRREFSVGDLGRLDEDGYLFLEGRREDLIISGGVNVYPAEVEAVLASVRGVDEVAVFGLEDDRWGQKVCAAVTGAVERARLEEAVTGTLAPYKRPKEYFLVSDLPRTSTGKVRRTAVPEHLGLYGGRLRDPRGGEGA